MINDEKMLSPIQLWQSGASFFKQKA